jgi:hypothetical protein
VFAAWAPIFGIVLAAVGLLLAIVALASGARGAKVVWATVLSGIALLIGIIVTSTRDLSGDDSGDGAPPAAVESEPRAAGLGDPVRDGKFEFTVTEVEAGVEEIGDESFGEKAQGQYVLVHLKIENIGDEAQTFDSENVTAFDADGREFSSDIDAELYLDESNSFLNQINPGNTSTGIVVFDVSKDTKITALELHDSFFSDGVRVELN